MPLNHSLEMHNGVLQRVPEVTGRQIPQWFAMLDEGPALLRFEDRVSWLRGEADMPLGYAQAIVHEHDLRRVRR
jgi:hypothetical protein